MPDLSPGSFAVQRCWQIMTGLHVASRVEAIEFLRAAERLPRLSIGEIQRLVEMFPLMPADQNGTRPWASGVCDDYESGEVGDPATSGRHDARHRISAA